MRFSVMTNIFKACCYKSSSFFNRSSFCKVFVEDFQQLLSFNKLYLKLGERIELFRKTVSGIMLSLMLISTLTLTLNIQPVKAEGTIYIRADGSVDPPTAPIQRDGDTYTFTDNVSEAIVVQRNNIVIDGASYTVQGTGNGIGIDLSDRINVTVKNSRIAGLETGILLSGSSRNTLLYNTIVNNSVGIGILELSVDNILSGNSISSNYQGVRVYRSRTNTLSSNIVANNQIWAILIEESTYNTLSDNIITNNNGHGVYLWGSLGNSVSNNTVTNNYGHGIFIQGSFRNTISLNKVICNYQYGIYLRSNIYWGSTNNTIFGNNVTNNDGGIHIYEEVWSLPYTYDNLIYHNNFINNTVQARGQYRNTWDDGYPSGGNFWSHYVNIDNYSGPYQNETGSDSIWDHPYVIDANNRDRYPLVNPWTPTPPIQTWCFDSDFQYNLDDNYGTIEGTGHLRGLATLSDGILSIEGQVTINGPLPSEVPEVYLIATDGQDKELTNQTVDLGYFSYWQTDPNTYNFSGQVPNVIQPINNGHYEASALITYNVAKYQFFVNTASLINNHYFPLTTPPNQPPIANFTYSPLKPLVSEEITFNASASFDPDGHIVSYYWNFGDGSPVSHGEIVPHSYSVAGDYTVTLTVTDNGGAINSTSMMVKVTEDWTFAIITDIHMGYNYTDYGTLGWDDSGGQNYTLTDRLTTIVNWINWHEESYNIHFVVVLGDISDSGEKSELIKARDLLNGLNVPYIPVIGNHDIWPYTQKVGTTDPNHIEYCWQDWRTTKGPYATIAEYPKTRPAIGDQFFDEVFWQQNNLNLEKIDKLFGSSFRRQSDAVEYRYIQNYAFTYKGIKFIALDFIDRNPVEDTQSAGAKLNADTEWWLSVNLLPNEKTILLSHHPMFYDRLANTGFSKPEAQLIGQIIRDSGAIVLKNFAGHTHRTAEAQGEGTDIQVVTTASICRESCSLMPDIFNLVTRETQTRLVTITYNQEIRSYNALINTIDEDINVPKPSWLAKARAFIGSLCPIDLNVTDPEGFTITKEIGAVSGMTYLECDWTGDGKLEDLIFLESLKPGNYQIKVIPEAGALPNDIYTLVIFSSDGVTLIAENITVGDIPSEPYIVNSTVFELNIPPTTLLEIGEPKIVNGTTYVSPATPLDLFASDNPYGSGLASIMYRVYNATFDTGWTIYTKSIYLIGLSDGTYNIDYYSTDCAGNIEPTNTTTVVLKNPNIGITNITLPKNIVGQGFNLHINVTVQNLGIFSENFNVTVYANTTAITTQTITLTSRNSTTITFTWNTTGFAKGNYTIWAYAWPVPDEKDTADNTYIDGWILVTIPADINGDFKVDWKDLLILARAYGSEEGEPGYVPEADFNSDGKIDWKDLLVLARNYGRTS